MCWGRRHWSRLQASDRRVTSLADGRCGACWEPLDEGALVCRVCGEDNSPDATAPVAAEEKASDQGHPDYYDRLGQWSQIKHDILVGYALEYTKILAKRIQFNKVYIDSFAGAGIAVDKATGELVGGSAYRMLFHVDPPFDRYHFIELDEQKVDSLRAEFGDDKRVHIHHGDANAVLLNEILPTCQWNQYVRALCLLDPYGLTVPWEVVTEIAKARTTEIFFNFMVEGANRNVLYKDLSKVSGARRQLLTSVIGDESWIEALYERRPTLFGDDDLRKMPGNEKLVRFYQDRLKKVAGFKFVPDPIPMRNTRNAAVYYLFFATHNEAAFRIVSYIFEKYRRLLA